MTTITTEQAEAEVARLRQVIADNEIVGMGEFLRLVRDFTEPFRGVPDMTSEQLHLRALQAVASFQESREAMRAALSGTAPAPVEKPKPCSDLVVDNDGVCARCGRDPEDHATEGSMCAGCGNVSGCVCKPAPVESPRSVAETRVLKCGACGTDITIHAVSLREARSVAERQREACAKAQEPWGELAERIRATPLVTDKEPTP